MSMTRGGDEGKAELGGGESVKKCRAEGLGKAESALMQTLRGLVTHTAMHTLACTQSSKEFCCNAVMNTFHIRMSYWAGLALRTPTPCCAGRLLHGLPELD